VAPGPEDAGIKLAVASSGGAFVVEATGTAHRAYRIEPGPPAVVSLEILHRATMVVGEVRQASSHLSLARPSVALEVTGAAGDVNASRLREEIALELSNDGVLLVPAKAPRDRTVCVVVGADEVTLATGVGATGCTEPTVKVSRTALSRDELAAQLRGQVAMLVRSEGMADRGADDDAWSVERDLGETPAPTKPKRPRSPAPSQGGRSGGFGLGAGTLARTGGIDPLIEANVGVRWPSGWGGRLQGTFSYSAGGSSLSINEQSIQAGPTLFVPLSGSFALNIGLLAGARIHRFNYHDADNGSRVGYDFALPAELTFGIGSPITLGLAVVPGFTGPPHEHTISDRTVWTRGSAYLGLALGIGVVM
jgi:hypothetical protein